MVLAVTMFLGAVIYNPHGDEAAWSIWNLRARFLFRAAALLARRIFERSHLEPSGLSAPVARAGCPVLEAGRAGIHRCSDRHCFSLCRSERRLVGGRARSLARKSVRLARWNALARHRQLVALSAALYGDVPLSFYILATLALLCLQDRHPEDLRFSALAGLMAGFAAWTRNEGMIFVVAMLVARVFACVQVPRAGRALPTATSLAGGIGSAASGGDRLPAARGRTERVALPTGFGDPEAPGGS